MSESGARQSGTGAVGGSSDARRVVIAVSGEVRASASAAVGADAPLPRVHPADEPLLLADDLAAVRGDGCFETLLLFRGRVAKPERHLARLRRSARMLDIEGPSDERWMAGIALAAKEWGPDGEAMLRLVLTRGPERGGEPTAYITVAPVGAAALRSRADGIEVCTLQRGFSIDLAAEAPWQLLGAKTLSYATNMAAVRHAARMGFDDVLFLSAEGEVLEGPRSTLVISRGGELISPPEGIGILEGTTFGAASELAERSGIPVRREHLLVTDLIAADGVWFLSSVTLAARVRRLDSTELALGQPSVDLPGLVDQALGRA